MFACIMTGIAGSVSAYIEAGIVGGKEDVLVDTGEERLIYHGKRDSAPAGERGQ